MTLCACHVSASCCNELPSGSGPSHTQDKLLTLRISKWQLTAVTEPVLYSPVQLAVNHSVLVLPQLVGAPMISEHDHLRFFALLSYLDIQHQVRLRVLNVEWHLHKQELLYSKQAKCDSLCERSRKHTLRHYRQYTWPADLICCYATSNMYLQSTCNIDRYGRICRES